MPFSCLVMDGLVRSEKFSRIRLTCGGLQPLSKSLYSGMYYCDLSRSFFPCVMVHAYLCKLRGIAWEGKEKKRRTYKAAILCHCLRCKLCLLYSSWPLFPFTISSLLCLLDMEALGHRSTDWCRVKWSWNWLFVFFNFKTQQQEKTKNYYRE